MRFAAKSFRLPASYFSLLVQRKVTKRKHLPRDIKTAQRVCGAVGIFGLGILPRSENAGHPWPPPSGFPALDSDWRRTNVKFNRLRLDISLSSAGLIHVAPGSRA